MVDTRDKKEKIPKYTSTIYLLIIVLFINIVLVSITSYGWQVFFLFTTWMMIVTLIWYTVWKRLESKGKLKNPFPILMMACWILLLTIRVRGYTKFRWLEETWAMIQLFLSICFISYFSYLIFSHLLGQRNKRILYKLLPKRRERKMLKFLTLIFLLTFSFSSFSFFIEPFVYWKSNENRIEIRNLALRITKNCTTDEEKVIAILDWFERHRGNMFNNWGYPSIVTGFLREIGICCDDGHNFFKPSIHLFVRTNNRDFPEWVYTIRSGRCEEYSILFREIAKYAGLTVRSIICKEADHLWDEVLIGGKWIIVDPSNVDYIRALEDKNYTGFNLSVEGFLKRFAKNKVSYVFAEYPDGTKEIVTERYLHPENISNITVLTIDDRGKPVPHAKVKVYSNNRVKKQDIEFEFKTDHKGKYQIRAGEGSLIFCAETDGILHLYGESTMIITGNTSYELKIIMRKSLNLENVWVKIISVALGSVTIIILLKVYVSKVKKKKVSENRPD